MDLNFANFYKNIDKIICGSVIDLSAVKFIHPWSVVMISLLLIERMELPDKKIILPDKIEIKTYLKRICFEKILHEFGYSQEYNELNSFTVPAKDNLNLQEIIHCYFRDEFNARLPRFISIFENFGLTLEESQRATAVVGELGNNVFDHNLGNWPTNNSGCIITAQNYPSYRRIEIAVGDPGVGFYGSLKAAFPNIKNDVEAIKTGLDGKTGRIGEERGNGLRIIQDWTINNFSGKVAIHSGNGLVIVSKDGMKEYTVNRTLGTVAQFVINYN